MNSSQMVAQTIDQPVDLKNWYILETPFYTSHNSQGPLLQISSMQFDSDWEETLNDIDELIQSEIRGARPFHGETQLFGEAGVEQLSVPMHVWTNDCSNESSIDNEWNFTGKRAFCNFPILSFDIGHGWATAFNRRRINLLLLQSSTKYKLDATLKKPWISVRISKIIRRSLLHPPYLAVCSGWIH